MKIIITSTQIPFMEGGAEILAKLLKKELEKRGHEAVIVTIPFKWYPPTSLFNCMLMGRMMDLTEVNGEKVDLVISLKFPTYYVKHENKVVWLLHQHRQAYDLWRTQYGDLHDMEGGELVKNIIQKHDNLYLNEAKRIFTISQNTTNRLLKYNGIKSTVLYHPPVNYDKLHFNECGDYVFYASRIDPMKRQRLLVDAARYVKSDIKIIIAGNINNQEGKYLTEQIKLYSLEDRVTLVGFISEEDKIMYYANCLCVYFGAYDEDYGYITLESFYSHKPVIIHPDAGGPLEFLQDGYNGFVIEENAQALAKVLDKLYFDREYCNKIGENAYMSIINKNISWDYVIDSLLSYRR
jgi:glycosyltransferase involved in cell wall biosynthesis